MTTTADLTAAQVMDASASMLNDTAKTSYTYTAQIPYLNMALRELQEFFELNNVPVTDNKSAVIEVDAGVTVVGFSPTPPIAGTPYLPDDFIEIKKLWQRNRGIDPWIPMTRLDTLDLALDGTETSQFYGYVYQSQEIRFQPSNADNDLKLDYIRRLFTTVTSSSDTLNVVNAQSFLSFRTAALCCEFIGENKSRADSLNADASIALDRTIGISTKARQAISVRHRPFRSAYKRRGIM
jgi:hypothetical protein